MWRCDVRKPFRSLKHKYTTFLDPEIAWWHGSLTAESGAACGGPLSAVTILAAKRGGGKGLRFFVFRIKRLFKSGAPQTELGGWYKFDCLKGSTTFASPFPFLLRED